MFMSVTANVKINFLLNAVLNVYFANWCASANEKINFGYNSKPCNMFNGYKKLVMLKLN